MNNHMIELLQKKNIFEGRLSELVYGTPEIRESGKKKYIYVHYRLSGRQASNFVGEYSKEVLDTIIKNNVEARAIKKKLKEIVHELNLMGYTERELDEKTKRNIDFAKRNLTLTIHSQAILEGVATTFASTEDVIEGAKVSGLSQKDIAKIINMKHAWEFILDSDVITSKTDLGLLMQINKLIEEGFYFNAGKIRDVPVKIGGTSWAPETPVESILEEDLEKIINSKMPKIDRAINLMLYIQRSQIFLDGNKRTAVIFANHYLIANGLGLIYVPEDLTEEYKTLLVEYYETGKKVNIATFLKEKCLLKI
ncbi:MAG: Fic family protein [Candidatus Saccharibacteria bacterium]|nr:Fic family protein [Candidatus Saccharibacteria bacterium]